jgi:hypothetical protein
VAYLSTNLGVLTSYFYFVAHMECYCISAIHLSGIVWINCLYVSVSESCESMIGYTTDLGKCLLKGSRCPRGGELGFSKN